MKVKRRLLTCVLTVLAAFSLIMGGGIPAYAEESSIPVPETKKALYDNGDGTYTLSLSVTGKAESSSENDKANVIIVFDSSGSMGYTVDTSTFTENDTGRYGYRNGNYVRLYRRSGNNYYQIDNDTTSGTVYYRERGMFSYNYYEYTGQRYSGQSSSSTRMAVAKAAVNSLTTELLKQNTIEGQDSDTIEVAFVDFAGDVKPTQGTQSWMTTQSNVSTVVDRFTANGGTNWEAALEAANNLAQAKLQSQPDETVYVIFVSDGNPTFRLSSYQDQYGRTNPDDSYDRPSGVHGAGDSDAYGWNLDAAQKSAAKITGNDSMELYAVGVFGDVDNMQSLGGEYYDAADSDALNEAFADIIGKITNALNVANVDITDQITGLTATTLVQTATDFKYYRSGGDYGSSNPDAGQYGTEWTSREADGANAATFSKQDGVEWNLGDNFNLENGVTYTVTFTVWPSQDAYDLVADLNNGTRSWDDLTDAEKEQVVEVDGKYAVKTNPEDGAKINYSVVDETTQTEEPKDVNGNPITFDADGKYKEPNPVVNPDGSTTEIVYQKNSDGTYTITKTSTPAKPVVIENPKNYMGLESTTMTVKKDWKDTLTSGEDRPESITLNVTEDGKNYYTVTLNDANNWEATVAIAPGIKVNPRDYGSDDNGIIPNAEGHEYSVAEPDVDLHYEFSVEPVHPMLNGLTTDNETDMVDLNSDKTWSGGVAALTATNTVKGGINVKKVVETEDGVTAPSDAQFSFTIKLTDDKGNPVYTTDDQFDQDGAPISGSLGYRIYNADGSTADRGTVPSSGEVTLSMTADQSIRIVNVPAGTKYAVTEGTLPDGFSLVSNVDGGDGVVHGNDSPTVTVTNKFEATEASVEKVWDDKEYQGVEGYERPASVEVTLTGAAGGKTVSTDTQTLSETNSWKYTWENLPKASGQTEIVYTVTEAVPVGYNADTKTADGVTTITNTPVAKEEVIDPVTLEITKTDKVAGGVLEGAVFTVVDGDGKQAATATTDKDGKATLTFTAAGTYTMTETAPAGYVADPGRWTIVVEQSGVDKVEYNATDSVWNWFYHLLFGSGTDYAEGKMTITNPSAVTKLTVDKVWNDNDNQDNKRPTELTYTIAATAGTETVDLSKYNVTATQTVKVANDGSASYTWENLPTKYNSTDITYKVTEAQIPEYQTEVSDPAAVEGGYKVTVTNTHAVDKTSVKVTKAWNDGNSEDRPESVSVTLYADGTAVGNAVILNADNSWTYTWSNLDVNTSGKAIVYTVDEAEVPNYAKSISEISGSAAAGYSYTITNTNTTIDTSTDTGAVLTKTVVADGTEWAPKTFEFTIEAVDGAPLGVDAEGNEVKAGSATFEKAGTQNIDFGKITFTKAGEYKYTVTETTESGDGWVCDNEAKTVTVTVVAAEDGTLTATPTAAEIKNEYKPTGILDTSTDAVLTKTVQAEGTEWAPKTFEFTIAAVDGAPAPTKTTGTATFNKAGTQTIDFGTITFTKAGTYTYTVTETTQSGNGWSCDNTPKNVTIEVVDNGDGTLTATPTAASITNVYNTSGTIDTSATPVLTKTVVADGTKWAPKTFDFTIAGVNGAPLGVDAEGNEVTSGTATFNEAGTQTIDFGTIKFTKAGTYTYTVTETTESGEGWECDNEPKTVTIEVVDNGDGTLTATPTAAQITNTYKPTGDLDTSTTPVLSKVLAGNELAADKTFGFTIAANGDAPKPEKSEGTATFAKGAKAGDSQTIDFGKITFTKAGTYTYTVTETTPSGNGWTCDNEPKTVTVTVVDNGDGTLTATPEAATITNTFAADGKDVISTISSETSVDGELVQAGDTLTYSIDYANTNSTAATVTIEDTIPSNTTYVEGSASNGGVYADGAIKWTIENVAAGETGTVTFQVTVNSVVDDTTIENTAKVSDGENQSSTNAVTTSVPVKKATSDGQDVSNNGSVQVGDTITYDVTFTLTEDATSVIVTDDVPANTTLVDGSISEGGAVSGNTITWDLGALKAGTYTVSFDVTVDESAVTKDAITNTAAINVNNHGDVKTNTTTTNTQKGGLTITKTVTVPEGFEIDKDAVFTFTINLTDKNGVALEGGYAYAGSSEGTVTNGSTVTLKHGESITIAGLPAGAKYEIVESEASGYTPAQGTISGTIPEGDTASETAAFENAYSTEAAKLELKAAKLLKVKEPATNPPDVSGAYTIAIEGSKDAPMPATKSFKNADGNGTATSFGEISFTKPGEYQYTITEEGTVKGVENGTASYTVRVKVTDQKNGSLKAEIVEGEATTTFENTYSVTPVTLPTEDQFHVSKNLTGTPLSAGAFEFTLTGADGAPMPAKTEATNDADGNVTFDTITYAKPGTYTYTIAEKDGGKGGYTYDTNTVTVTVVVTDNGEGALEAVVSYSDDTEFDNSYAASGVVNLSAQKKLTGRGIEEGQFTFELVDENGKVLQTKTNNGSGAVQFDAIEYTEGIFDEKKADEATAEDKTEAEGTDTEITDQAVEAPVEDAAQAVDEAEAVETEAAPVETEAAEVATEVAEAEAAPAEAEAEPEAAEAEDDGFSVTDIAGFISRNVFAPKVAWAEEAAELEAAEAGRTKTFTYTIREVNDGAAGYTYDTHVETVTVTVTDNDDGTLTAVEAYDEDGAVFTNAYEATGSVQFGGTKAIETETDRTLAEGEFTFQLKDADGKVVEEVKNAADGSFQFSALNYVQNAEQKDADTGTFTYTIVEVNDGKDGFTYDSHVCDVTVTVSDNGDGTLACVAELSDGEAASFVNPYTPLATTIKLEATKQLTGRTLKAGEFTFELSDADGKIIATVKNAADGSINFGEIMFTEVGEYTFTAKEVKGTDANVTYDESVLTYVVTVVDNDGQLEATLEDGKDYVFKNKYTEPPVPSTPKRKKVLPKTSDDSMPTSVVIATGIAGASLVAAGLSMRLRKEED